MADGRKMGVMNRLSGRLRSGSVRVACEALAEEESSGAENTWMGDVGAGDATAGSTESDPSSSLHYRLYPSRSLANGLRNLGDQYQRQTRRRRQMDSAEQMHTHEQILIQQHTQPQIHMHQQPQSFEPQNTQTEHSNKHQQSQTHIQMDVHAQTDKFTHAEMNKSVTEENVSLVPEDLSLTPKPERYASFGHPTVQSQSNQLTPNYSDLEPSPVCKVNSDPLNDNIPKKKAILKPDIGHSSSENHSLVNTPIDAERKYTLRSSARPRFPCHLRKSSRLRRPTENVIKKEEQKEKEENINNWTEDVKEEQAVNFAVTGSSTAILPTSTKSTGMLPIPNVNMAFASEGNIVSQPSTRGRQHGRYLGVKKIVVKIARIPVHLSRRQKSYKISSLESLGVGPQREVVTGGEVKEGEKIGDLGTPPSKEPTPLLRMKNNGKSVMVMFPPGELPIILKRRRGRPPKQAVPGQPDIRESKAGAANATEPKKPRRRRRVKLPPPMPCYANDTNDVKVEYADVLSKMAFLNRQPPTTGRCSPPRCWTPTEPETFHTSPENPNLSTLLHRLTGFRRRGGRAGCMGGRGGGMVGSSEAFKRSFSDFFETIGKKRKAPLSETGLPRKRGKGPRARMRRVNLGEDGIHLPGEKVQKRRSKKNGELKVCRKGQNQDWQNGNGEWGEKCVPDEMGSGKGTLSSRGSFLTSDLGKGVVYHSPGGMRAGSSGEECQGMFSGYFRSLLDSDDSTDLLDMSMSSPTGHQDTRKITVGYEGSSPGAAHCWSPAFSKRSPKVAACTGEGGQVSSAQTQSNSAARPQYSFSISQTSPTISYSKSPALSLSRSPNSPYPSAVFSQYPSSYGGSTPQGPKQQHRPSDCSFTYGVKSTSAPSTQRQINYSNYQTSAKRHYSGYSGPNQVVMQHSESAGPVSPGVSYMSISKTSPFSSSLSSPEGPRQYQSLTVWGHRQEGATWGGDGFSPHQFHGYSDFGMSGTSSESKDILDISNYTPQKVKQRSFPDTFSESSSDSSHTGMGNLSGSFCPRDALVPEGQSSLSSLEKLMLDWNENSSGPSYNWSQNVLFHGGTKPTRGRKRKTESQSEKETGQLPPGSPTSPPVHGGGLKRSAPTGRQPRGGRGRGGFSPCQRERPLHPKSKKPTITVSAVTGQVTPTGGLYQETLDYYSGDSSSLSPLSHAPEPCEYPSPSPYSAQTSTPSSDERFAHTYPSDTVSPSHLTQSDVLKQSPKPASLTQAYGHVTRTFSPTLSPSPRLLTQCGSAMSPHQVSKDQFPQYDSPSYSSSPCWYGPGGNVAHSPQSYEDLRSTATSMPSHKRDMTLTGPGIRAPAHGSYPTSIIRGHTVSSSCAGGNQDTSPQQDDLSYHGNMDSYASLGHRHVSQGARGGSLCQLLDHPGEESFTVTSL